MQLTGLAGVLLAQGATPVDQEPQHLELLVGDHRPHPDILVPTSATRPAALDAAVDAFTPSSDARTVPIVEPGGQRCFELGNPSRASPDPGDARTAQAK
ncbi:hypothetical protein GCM10023350_51980 [Nocardioides endophyticus]|uniref:Uncharacterized protein n=1 Tax=Nocardioides endophyticus TaxID=1353775 RepID=A0ABP8ZL41_9ACTN